MSVLVSTPAIAATSARQTTARPAHAALRPQAPRSATAISPGGTWNWQNPLPNGNPLYAISCPTTNTCFAAGLSAPILMTSNGGTTWTPQATAAGVLAMSCPGTLVCIGVGEGGLVISTSNGGSSWQSQTVGGGAIQFLHDVSCPTLSVCYTVGSSGNIWKTSSGGVTWTPLNSGIASNLFGISCTSAGSCLAVGDAGLVVTTADGGTTWPFTSSGVTGGLDAVSCASALVCTAVGPYGATATTLNGGATWSTANVSPAVQLTAVSCPDATICTATAKDGKVYIEISGAWGRAYVGEPGGLWNLSCPSHSTCFVVGDFGIIAATTVGGSGWVTESPSSWAAASSTTYSGVSCPSSTVCVAVGSTVVWTADGGATWTSPSASAPTGMAAVSCPSTTTCFAVGGSAVFATANSGSTWAAQNPGSVSGLEAVSCPTTNVCFAVGGAGAIVATTDGGTHWSSQASGAAGPLTGISCPTTSSCFATGRSANGGSWGFYGTTNGGAAWSLLSTAAVQTYLYGISCPTTAVCFAAGGPGIVGSTDGALTWTNETPSGVSAYALSCTSATSCIAVGEGGALAATTNGTTWTSQGPVNGSWYAVSCATSATCIAAGAQGNALRTTNGGATWLRILPPGTHDNLTGVSCPSTTICFAAGTGPNGVDASIYESTNGGATWGQVANLQGSIVNPGCAPPVACYVQLARISCPTTSVCVATGSGPVAGEIVLRTIDGGATWITGSMGAINQVLDVSCPSSSSCIAAIGDGGVTRTSDSGATWGARIAVTASGLTGINCPSTSFCFATDGGTPGKVYVSTDGGGTWSLSFDLATDTQAGSSQPFKAIDCESPSTCTAVGLSGLLATTTDSGAHWRTGSTSSTATLNSVSCPSASTCFAASDASAILQSTDFGGTWQDQFGGILPPGFSGLAAAPGSFQAIGCPSTTMCVAVGAGGLIVRTTTGGAAWTKQVPAQSNAPILAISCVDASNCAAAAHSTALVTHDGGSTWVSHALANADVVNGVACPTLSNCYAVGWPGAIYRTTDGGTSWSFVPNPLAGADQTLTSVSCTGSTSCIAVGTDGHILSTTDGVTWSAQASSTTQNLWGVACSSISSCVAVGDGGTALMYGSGSWHLTATGTANHLAAVSCPTASVCFAVGRSGTVLLTSNAGAGWTPQTTGVTYNLLGVDCLQANFCLAAGGGGTVIYTSDGTTWLPVPIPTGSTLRGTALLGSNHAWVVGDGGTILEDSSVFSASQPAVSRVSPSAGPSFGESYVTITGTGFSAGMSAVRFGTTAAVGFTVVNDTTATGFSPANSTGTVDVTVTTLGGTSAISSADQFQFQPPSAYTPVTPVRLLDTRNTGPTLGNGASLNLTIGGVAGVPSNATAAVVNVTAVDETTAGAFIVYPAGAPRPLASNLNWVAHETVANLVTVGLGSGGAITIYNGAGSADAVVDLEGYYAPSNGSSGGSFVPLQPTRITDTRPGSGQANAGSTLGPLQNLDVQVTGVAGVGGAGVIGVVLNVTATNTTAPGFFTAFPTGAPLPLASNLNWTTGVTVPNRVIVPVGAGGKVTFHNGLGYADLIVDVNGFFVDSSWTGAGCPKACVLETSFVPLTPSRIVDTRYGIGGFSSPLVQGAPMVVTVAGTGGVPGMDMAVPPRAVVLNVTVEGATAASDLTVWPDLASLPVASDLNFARGQTVPNLVIVTVSWSGKIDIRNDFGSTSVIVDVVGWYG